MPEIERYTPLQMEDEIQDLAEKYVSAVGELEEDAAIFNDISTAIQSKTGQVEPYGKDEMASEITDELIKPNFETKEVTPTTVQQDITVTPNTQYNGLEKITVKATPLEHGSATPSHSQVTYTPESPNIGFSDFTVGAAPAPVLQSKTVTPTTSQQSVIPDSGYDGLLDVTVLAALFGIDTESLSHFEFGIDNEGLYYTDEIGGGTPVYMGVDTRGLYVIGGVANA